MRDIIFAFVWIALLPLLLVSAYSGALVWVWSALLSPNEMMYGFMAGMPLNKIAAVLTIFLIFSSKEKKDPYFDFTLFFLVLLGLQGTVSQFDGIASTQSVTGMYTGFDLYEKLLKEIVLAVVITAVMTTRARIDRLVLVIVLSIGFLAIKEGTIFLATAGGHVITGNLAIGDNNGVAMVLLMIIPLISYLARFSVVPIIRMGMWAMVGLSLVTVLATYSRGGLIGMGVLAIFSIINGKRRIFIFSSFLVVGVALYFLAPDNWFARMDTIQNAAEDSSFSGRVVAWKMSLLIAMDNPVFGGGMHAVQDQLVWDTYKKDLHALDFVDTPPPGERALAAHSIYFEVLGDHGFVGLILFLTILGAAIWNCRQVYRMSQGHPSLVWAANLARMLEISVFVYLTTGAALSEAYIELIYILIALISRLRRTVQLTLTSEMVSGAVDPDRRSGKPVFARSRV